MPIFWGTCILFNIYIFSLRVSVCYAMASFGINNYLKKLETQRWNSHSISNPASKWEVLNYSALGRLFKPVSVFPLLHKTAISAELTLVFQYLDTGLIKIQAKLNIQSNICQ